MIVGILSAIHPATSQVNWGGSPIDAYTRFLRRAGAPFEFVGFEAAQGELPSTPDSCDAFVITGSPNGAYEDEPWIAALAAFLREAYAASQKLVGICFGHQILAHALGGSVVLSDKGWGLGPRQVAIHEQRPWMARSPAKVALYFAHQDQVIALPPGAALLGGDSFCPIGLYEIDGRVLGIQGHPEFDAGMMRGILERMDGKTEPERLNAAREALANMTPDNELVAEWILGFLLQKTEV